MTVETFRLPCTYVALVAGIALVTGVIGLWSPSDRVMGFTFAVYTATIFASGYLTHREASIRRRLQRAYWNTRRDRDRE